MEELNSNSPYYQLTRIFNVNLASIFIGIDSGIMINLLTSGQNYVYYLSSILIYFISIIDLIFIIRLGDEFNQRFNTQKYNKENIKSEPQLWNLAINDKSNFKKRFYFYFYSWVFMFILALLFMFHANNKINNNNDKKQDAENKFLFQLMDSIKEIKINGEIQTSNLLSKIEKLEKCCTN